MANNRMNITNILNHQIYLYFLQTFVITIAHRLNSIHTKVQTNLTSPEGPGGSIIQVVGLPSTSYKFIINTTWVRARLCKLQKGCTRLAAASDKAYQLLAHGRQFSLGTTASSTTKIGRHDIAEILLKVALNTINQS